MPSGVETSNNNNKTILSKRSLIGFGSGYGDGGDWANAWNQFSNPWNGPKIPGPQAW